MKGLFSIIWSAIRIFRKSGSLDRAAAISFYFLFSLMPIMFFIAAALGVILGGRAGLLEKVAAMAKESFPYLSGRLSGDLKGLSSSWNAFGWVSLIILISSAELVLAALSDALIAIFDVRERFGFFRRKAVHFAVLLTAVAAALASAVVTAGVKIAQKIDVSVFGVDIAYYLIESLTLKYILPFSLVVLSVSAVYRISSGPNLNMRYSFYGSIVFSVLWEAAKNVFAWYIVFFPAYNRFYGSLGAIMVLLAWIFLTANLFLFSAAVARAAYEAKGGPAASPRGGRPGGK
ncbi:MAG: YihY/virulence factor BrkB family protein [Deltaproteobacteria bacterium]|nr:YihY/virulence factor BrkB family protein [Deltaproteobacteria bacterium]